MAAEQAISKGALQTLFKDQHVDNPVFQCVHLKAMATTQGSNVERYRLVFSDVDNFIQSMLGTQLNHLIHEGKFSKGCIVRLTNYQQQEVKGKRILVVLDCEVLEEYGVLEKIGQPVALDPKDAKAEDEGPQQQQQQQPGAIPAPGFYGNNQQSAPQTQSRSLPTRPNGNKSGGASTYGNIYPIEALSPYAHKWTIKVRCSHKSDIKHYHNKNGEGKLFSANFLDDSGEIRATGFNDQVDALYELFQDGGVYYISSPCKVQLAKKQFSNLNNDYELMFERDTLVEKAEDSTDVPQVRFNFTSVGDLQSVEKDTTIDTIGILKEVGEVSQIVSKTQGTPFIKRELTVVDNSNFSVRLTIWGNTATNFEVPLESVIAFKGVKVSDFGGRSLSLLSSGAMTVDPDIDEAHKLKGWYDAQGREDTFQSHAAVMGSTMGTGKAQEYKTIAAVQDERLGFSEKTDWFTLKATVVYIKQDNIAYPACQSPDCNKKVVNTDPDEWRCEKCDKSFPKPQYRYILSVSVNDHTGQMWLSCFDDAARLLLGMPADDLVEMKENDEKAYSDKIAEATCQTFIFRCRAKMDTYQDQERVRYQVSSVQPLNFSAESTRLAELIKRYSLDNDNALFVN